MPVMESVTLENFRCFREKQTVNLAPLTLLVGENSTGKTSFLALVHALTEYAYERREPSFKNAPFDLGTFEEIAHSPRDSSASAESFAAGVTGHIAWQPRDTPGSIPKSILASLDLTFGKPERGTVPTLIRQRASSGDVWIDERISNDSGIYAATLNTRRGEWALSGSTSAFGTLALLLRIYDVFSSISSR